MLSQIRTFFLFKGNIGKMCGTVQEATLSPGSEEVDFVLGGFIAKRLMEKRDCHLCKQFVLGDSKKRIGRYFDLLSVEVKLCYQLVLLGML